MYFTLNDWYFYFVMRFGVKISDGCFLVSCVLCVSKLLHKERQEIFAAHSFGSVTVPAVHGGCGTKTTRQKITSLPII